MKTYREIKRIITGEFGFKSLETYKIWSEQVRPTISLTSDRIEKLSPDVVNCRDFWKVCEELFGTDPVCNVTVPPSVGRLPYAIETHADANRMNLRLAKSLGITAFLDENAGVRLRTLEIGPGYGSLKNYIETNTNHVYTGVDVYPRIPGVIATTPDGLMPAELIEPGTYGYVVSSNVFQHLSARQRTRYIKDAHTILREGGLFIFNIIIDTGKIPAYVRDQDGNAWADHYGQYTPIPKAESVYGELSRPFGILYVTQRYDGLFNFVCQKR